MEINLMSKKIKIVVLLITSLIFGSVSFSSHADVEVPSPLEDAEIGRAHV